MICRGAARGEIPRLRLGITRSIHCAELCDRPAGIFQLSSNPQVLKLPRRCVVAMDVIVEDDKGRRIFAVKQLPGKQRVLLLRLASEFRVLAAVVLEPTIKLLAATAIMNSANDFFSGTLRRAIANRIQRNA